MAHRLAPMLKTDNISNIENELRRLAFHEDARIRRHFLRIPPFIKDVVSKASNTYAY